MSYIQDSLSKDEKIGYLFKLHWISKIAPVLISFFLVMLAIPTAGITLLAVPFTIIYSYFYFEKLEQGVTNKRVILKTGLFFVKTREVSLASIDSIEIGYGKVVITATGIKKIVFKSINNPLEVKKQIESMKLKTIGISMMSQIKNQSLKRRNQRF